MKEGRGGAGQTSWVMETLASTAHLLNSTKHYQTYTYTKREKRRNIL